MALPTINDVQAAEPILTNMLVGYMQAESRFVASQVFPTVPVANDSGQFYKFDKKYWFLDGLQQRAPGGEFNSVEFGLSTDTYKTVQFAADEALADEIRANSQVPMDLETAMVNHFGQLSLLRKEIQFAADFMVTGVWGTTNTDKTDWDDYSSGDPIANVQEAKDTISSNTGYEPNTLVVGRPVHAALVNHPDILDRLKYVAAATMSTVEQSIAAIFGLDRYIVARASYSNTNEAATFSASNIIDDDALLVYVNPNAGVFDATAGKTFVWGPGGGLGSMYRYRADSRHADVIQHKEQWDQKAVATDLGYIWLDIV